MQLLIILSTRFKQATVRLRTVEPLTKPVNTPSLSTTGDWPKPKPKFNTVINLDQYINPPNPIPVEFESPNNQPKLKTEHAPIEVANEEDEDASSSGEEAELEGDLETSRVIILQPLPDIDTVRIHFTDLASGDFQEDKEEGK